jgi:hypothetical protein
VSFTFRLLLLYEPFEDFYFDLEDAKDFWLNLFPENNDLLLTEFVFLDFCPTYG